MDGNRKMLTGVHPFDIQGRATDEDIEREVNLNVASYRVSRLDYLTRTQVRNCDAPLPLGPKHPFTRHLSPSARDLIASLMERDPKKRLSAFEMLHHPWVTGETASTNIMIGSDQRLNRFRKVRDIRRLVAYRTQQLAKFDVHVVQN